MRLLAVSTCCFLPCTYAYAIVRGDSSIDSLGSDHSLQLGETSPNHLSAQDPLTSTVSSQPKSLQPLDPYPGKPRISFNDDGTFKLTVFSDVHFGENPWDAWGPQQDVNTTALMEKLLKVEEPDFVVINGDLITGEDTFRENATSLIDEIVRPLNTAQVPFCSTSGNHDSDINITRAGEMVRELEISPLSYTRFSPPGVGGDGGPANYWIPVYQNSADCSPVLILWFFDSRGGVFQNGTHMPDWVDSSVATWIENETAEMNKIWGSPENRSALAFVHIPPHIIQTVQKHLNSTLDPGLNADTLGQGSTQGTIVSASQGKDHPFWQSLNTNVKNLRAVISGHDHGNEWCSREPTYDMIFCFNKHSGYGGYSGPHWGRGVRTLLFQSTTPAQGIETYILMENGTSHARVVLDEDFR